MIWTLAPKGQLFAVAAAVAEAVTKLNSGNNKASSAILQELHLNLAQLNSKRMAEKDKRQAPASARKHAAAQNLQLTFKKCHSGGSGQTDYTPGGYWPLSNVTASQIFLTSV